MRIAYYALHYGKEYLAHSVRSIQDAVDEIHMLYSAKPSFGIPTAEINPDSLEDLKIEAARFATKPIVWHYGQWNGEGQHRDAINEIGLDRGASVVAVVDADELWHPEAFRSSLDMIENSPKPGVNRYRTWFAHLWRSFGYICLDPCVPERFIDLRCPGGVIDYLPREAQTHPVYHFGYAQSEALMRYKWKIHGHQNDLRPNWMERFMNWKPGDLDMHPTNENFWNPEPTDADTKAVLRRLLHDHPYYGREIIR